MLFLLSVFCLVFDVNSLAFELVNIYDFQYAVRINFTNTTTPSIDDGYLLLVDTGSYDSWYVFYLIYYSQLSPRLFFFRLRSSESKGCSKMTSAPGLQRAKLGAPIYQITYGDGLKGTYIRDVPAKSLICSVKGDQILINAVLSSPGPDVPNMKVPNLPIVVVDQCVADRTVLATDGVLGTSHGTSWEGFARSWEGFGTSWAEFGRGFEIAGPKTCKLILTSDHLFSI